MSKTLQELNLEQRALSIGEDATDAALEQFNEGECNEQQLKGFYNRLNAWAQETERLLEALKWVGLKT